MSKLRKTMTSRDQEKLLEDFYDQLDDDTFLGNSFEDEDNFPVVVIAPELSSDDDDDNDDDDDDVIDELELDDVDNVVEEPQVPSLPRKQGLANLDKVTNYENFDPIPPQEHATFRDSNMKKSYVVEWETMREENIHRSGRLPARNVLSNRAGPIQQASSFETLLDGFNYFMPDSLLLFILENTNKKVQNFRDCFADNSEYCYKNKHCKLLDMVDLKAFFRLLYLQASLKSNLS